jgi:hypothetical protein
MIEQNACSELSFQDDSIGSQNGNSALRVWMRIKIQQEVAMAQRAILMTLYAAIIGAFSFLTTGCAAHQNRGLISEEYFPENAFQEMDLSGTYVSEVFKAYLSKAKEPALYADSTIEFAVRVGIVGPFGSVFIRVQQQIDGSVYGVLTRFDVSNDDHERTEENIGPILRERAFRVSETDLEKLREEVSGSGFWNQSNQQEDVILVGGDGWLLEIKERDKYHLVYRAYPHAGPVFDIGVLMLEIAGFDMEELRPPVDHGEM